MLFRSRVICIGAPADRLEIAARWGADSTLDFLATTGEERAQAVRDLSEGRGADLVVECSGAAAAFEEGFDLVRRGGRYLILGQADPRPSRIHATNINLRQLTVLGTISADVSHYRRAVTFIDDNAGRFDFEALLGTSYHLDQVNDALEAMRGAVEPKPVIVPAGG